MVAGGGHGCGGGHVWLPGGACVAAGGHAWLGGMHGYRRHAWLQGACVVVGGHAWLQGACVVVGDA